MVFTRVVFFGALPMIFAGLRIALAVSFIVLVAAEFVATKTGIGYLIWNSWELLQVDYMFVGIVVDRHPRPDHVGRVPGNRAQGHPVEGGVIDCPRRIDSTESRHRRVCPGDPD